MQEQPKEENESAVSSETPEKQIEEVIKHHVYAAMAVGLVPIPFVDFVGVAGIQLNLLRKLAQIYNIPFSKDMVKNLIGALLGGAFPASVGARMGGSAAKIVPGIGHALGAVTVPVVSGASTYAIGKVFNRHFSEGGTFLTFDAEKAKAFYAEMFKEGEKVAAELKSQKEKGKNL